jgi:uncharacterized protein (DUF1778 family)/predicted GNAT family N-acyltransferase
MRHGAARKTTRSKSKEIEARAESASRPRRARSERLNARITPDDQALLTKVAAMQGVSVSTFVIQAARARANALLRRQRLIRLSARDQKTLISALLSPAEPNVALVRAAASHARELARRSAPAAPATNPDQVRRLGNNTEWLVSSEPIRPFITTPLASHHDRAAFTCGKASLDNYLRDRAVPDAKGLSTITFVLVDEADERTIHGYYSLSSTSVEFGAVPANVVKALRISKHRLMSATLIARLAVSAPMQGRGLGEGLVFDALKRAMVAAQHVSSALVIVHALDEDAAKFYKKYGFTAFVDVERGLFLPTATVTRLIR